MADSYRNIISAAGEDVDREGIVDTPMRAAKAFAFFTKVQTAPLTVTPVTVTHYSYCDTFLAPLMCFDYLRL